MTKHTGNRQNRFKAFSLIELLAVVAILGVLVTIVVPAISLSSRYAKERVCRQYKSDLNSALEEYFTEEGVWPDDLTDLEGDYYPEEIPICPADNNDYTIDADTHRISAHDHY